MAVQESLNKERNNPGSAKDSIDVSKKLLPENASYHEIIRNVGRGGGVFFPSSIVAALVMPKGDFANAMLDQFSIVNKEQGSLLMITKNNKGEYGLAIGAKGITSHSMEKYCNVKSDGDKFKVELRYPGSNTQMFEIEIPANKRHIAKVAGVETNRIDLSYLNPVPKDYVPNSYGEIRHYGRPAGTDPTPLGEHLTKHGNELRNLKTGEELQIPSGRIFFKASNGELFYNSQGSSDNTYGKIVNGKDDPSGDWYIRNNKNEMKKVNLRFDIFTGEGKVYDSKGVELKLNPEQNVYAVKAADSKSGFEYFRLAPDGQLQPVETK